jgi:hypothetical protein
MDLTLLHPPVSLPFKVNLQLSRMIALPNYPFYTRLPGAHLLLDTVLINLIYSQIKTLSPTRVNIRITYTIT